jgi:hypothetical protein
LSNETNPPESAWRVGARGMAPAGDLHGSSTPHPVSYYVATLDQVENTARYTGPISGVVNERTRAAIQHWLHNRYRCPVVIEAWRMSGNNRSDLFNGGVNIWRHNEVTTTSGVRVFSRDFTQKYNYQLCNKDSTAYHILGLWWPTNGFGGGLNGPRYKTTWTRAELMPEYLIGAESSVQHLQNNPTSAITKTYKVIRAVSEQECIGYFDVVNTWDDALVSWGPCHWTLGINASGKYINGELSAFLSYLLERDRDSYMEAFGCYGLLPNARWGDDGQSHLVASQGKYTGWIRCHAEGTTIEAADSLVPAVQNANATTQPNISSLPEANRKHAEAHYYKSWHWFFRWVMAGRTIVSLQEAAWCMARIRIRDMLNSMHHIQTTTAQGVAVNFTRRLGDMVTSERGTALLLRWHVWRPAHVFGIDAAATPHIRNQITQAVHGSSLNWNLPPGQWTQQHEDALYNKLYEKATSPSMNNTTFAIVHAWPGGNRSLWALHAELGTLSSARGSFILDTTGI